MNDALLSPSLLRRLEQLELLARRRSRSSGRGERRSKARGQSVEFADYRPYVPGDDLRRLDWNLYGRLDRLFVKLYEEERELPVHVFLDASESMVFGQPSKFDFARRLAAAIGYIALCGFDRVSVRVFPEEALTQAGPGGRAVASVAALRALRGKRSAMTLFQGLAGLGAGGAAELNRALRRGALETRQPGTAVVITDLLDPEGYEDGLDALIARGFHIQVAQVLAREELNPEVFGDLRLVDSETGGEQEVTFGRHRLRAYRQVVENYTQKAREFCLARGVGFFRVASDASLEDLLLKDLRAAGVVG